MENWGFQIKKLREQVHPRLTQQELAKRAGFKRQHLSNIERGVYKTFKPEYIERLAPHLNTTKQNLLQLICGQTESQNEYDGDSITDLMGELELIIQEIRKRLKDNS